MKRLIGKTEVEDGFQQLDLLTKEENLMTAACTLGVASDIRHDTKTIKEDTRGIKDDARDIKEDIRDIKDDTRDIKDDTRNIKEDTRNIKDDVRNIGEVNKRGAPYFFKSLRRVPIFPCHILI